MSRRFNEIICKAIERMTPKELAELIEALSQRFGVTVTIPQSASLLPGWRAVPLKVTPEMVAAARGYSWTGHTAEINVRNMLADVFAAAPPYPDDPEISA
jgi:hypothetical protein